MGYRKWPYVKSMGYRNWPYVRVWKCFKFRTASFRVRRILFFHSKRHQKQIEKRTQEEKRTLANHLIININQWNLHILLFWISYWLSPWAYRNRPYVSPWVHRNCPYGSPWVHTNCPYVSPWAYRNEQQKKRKYHIIIKSPKYQKVQKKRV